MEQDHFLTQKMIICGVPPGTIKNIKNILMKNVIVLFTAIFMLAGCIKKDINPAEGTPYEEASLYVLRNTYKSGDKTLAPADLGGAFLTAGVVISESENKNFPEGYIAIENIWRGQIRGLLVKVDNPALFSFGDSVRINVDGAVLTREAGALALKNLKPGGIQKIEGVKITKTHRPVSIANIEADPGMYESTLISITADVTPDIQPNEAFKGNKKLLDGESKQIDLYTNETAVFANDKIAPSATFKGILINKNDKPTLLMQSLADMAFPSGKLYGSWPETFEVPYQGKTSYNVAATNNLLELSTGTWYMLQCIQGETAGRDRIVSGKQAIRFQQNLTTSAFLQMNFDVPDGASKVTFWYGSYYTDRSCTFQLEYSTDQGITWTKIGESISDAHSTAESLIAKQAVFLMDIQGTVRFRINKLGLGTSNNTVSNGRLGVDDFAIYKSY